MLNNISLGTYINKDSVVHKLNPVFKIISLIIMITSVLCIKSYISMLILTLYLITSIMYSNISMKVYLKNMVLKIINNQKNIKIKRMKY